MKVLNNFLVRLTIFIVLVLIQGKVAFGQENIITKEPVKSEVQVMQTEASQNDNQQLTQENPASGNQGINTDVNQSGTAKKNAQPASDIKQVKSSRPDLSKAKGARPPTIVRPSGSGIPKGLGRPGGAAGQGRR